MAAIAEWLSTGLKVSSELSGKLKGLRDLEKQLDQAELKAELLNAAEQALELREALLRAREELQNSEAKIADLESVLAGKETVKRVNGLLRELDADGEVTNVRICDRCKAIEDKQVPMTRQDEGRYICPHCKAPKAEDTAPPRPTSTFVRM
jgi:hypothetical protein